MHYITEKPQKLFSVDFRLFVCLFHLYPPVTKKRRWPYILDESEPAYRSCPFPSFPVISIDFLPLNLLLVRSHQAEIIIVKRLIQGRNNVCDEGVS